MQKAKLLTFTIIATLLAVSLIALPALAITVPTFTVSPSSHILIPLPAGTILNGSFATTGAIRFWINTPNGAPGLNLGLIDKTATFGFVAQEDGNYTFNFENGIISSDPAQVTFSYVTDPDLSGGGNSTAIPFTYLVMLIVIAMVGSFIIVFLIRRKNKLNLVKTSSGT
jgi:hypothetical protein